MLQQIITNVCLEIQMVNGATNTDVKRLLIIGEFNNIVIVISKTPCVAALHLAVYSISYFKAILLKMNVTERLERVFVFILILDNVLPKVIYLKMMILYFLV